jgi:hypothetical protein
LQSCLFIEQKKWVKTASRLAYALQLQPSDWLMLFFAPHALSVAPQLPVVCHRRFSHNWKDFQKLLSALGALSAF